MTLIFKFDLRSGQVQVKKGHILKVYIAFSKHIYLVQFCLMIQKMSFVLSYDNEKFQKSSFKKSDVIVITWFWGHRTAKNEDMGLKFCTLVDDTPLYNIYSGFSDVYKIFRIFMHLFS